MADEIERVAETLRQMVQAYSVILTPADVLHAEFTGRARAIILSSAGRMDGQVIDDLLTLVAAYDRVTAEYQGKAIPRGEASRG